MKLLSYEDLRPIKGICYSKTQLWRLEKAGALLPAALRGNLITLTPRHDAANASGTGKGPILTAIPAGERWRLKAISPAGTIEVSPDAFGNRLEALGACLLLAESCGARVVP